MKKIVIFDFDGTIADTRPVILGTFHRTFGAMHLPQHSDDEIAATIGLPLAEAFVRLLPADATGRAADCVATYRRLFDETQAETPATLFGNVAGTLRQLHGMGLTLTIATSRGHESVCAFMRGFGLDDIIAYTVAAEDVTHAKPDAEPVERTLSHLGFSPDEAVVVGDTSFDILMGRNAGCTTIGVTYGNGSPESLHEAGADAVVDDFAEITRLIAGQTT